MVINCKSVDFDYLRDFHVTEKLIEKINNASINPCINQEVAMYYLSMYGLKEMDNIDVQNIINALCTQCMTMYTETGFIYNFSEEDVRRFVVSYIEWFNYFCYQYAIDYRFQAKPVIWDAQRTYNEYTIMKLEHGALMEAFVGREFEKYGIDIGFYYDPVNQSRGENKARIEIKHDMASERTGNYYIEFGENLCEQNFVYSGIFKKDDSIFWLIGTPNDYHIVYKKDLQELFFSMNPNDASWQDGKKFVSNKTSRGFVVKKHILQQIAVAHSVGEFVSKYSLVEAIK
jgi:hypothetical protein